MYILSKTKNLIGFLFLVLIVALFIYSLGQRGQGTQEQSGYPVIESVTEQLPPYPAPLQARPIPTIGDLPEPHWVTYSDKEAGYSFTYKSNFLIFDSKNAGEPFNHVRIFLGIGNEQMLIAILENPYRLSLEQFLKTDLETPYAYYLQPDDAWKAADFSEHIQPINIEGQSGVLIERSDTTISLTGRSKYVAFIPYEDRVIRIILGVTDTMSYHEPPPQSLEYFLQIINSIQFDQ